MLDNTDISYIKDLIIFAGDIAHNTNISELKIELKQDNSPVTHADKVISTEIARGLSKLKPNISIISEEEPIPDSITNSFWLVDPIDSTRSYIAGKKTYTVNIGLIENGIATYGFIYQPAIKLLHYTNAHKKLCIEENGMTKLKVDIPTNSPIKAAISDTNTNKATKVFLAQNNITDIIHIPSSIKLSLVAEGIVDVYPSFGHTMEWDIAAGHALIKAAGGDILDLNNQPIKYLKNKLLNNGFIAYGPRFQSHII